VTDHSNREKGGGNEEGKRDESLLGTTLENLLPSLGNSSLLLWACLGAGQVSPAERVIGKDEGGQGEGRKKSAN